MALDTMQHLLVLIEEREYESCPPLYKQELVAPGILEERDYESCHTLFQQVVVGTGLRLSFSDFLFEEVEEFHIRQYLIGTSILVFRHFGRFLI